MLVLVHVKEKSVHKILIRILCQEKRKKSLPYCF